MSALSDHAGSGPLSLDALVGLLEKIFLRHGTSAEVARTLAENCARAERDGATAMAFSVCRAMSRR